MKNCEDIFKYGHLGLPTTLKNYLIAGDFDKAQLYISQKTGGSQVFGWEQTLYEYALLYIKSVLEEYTLSYDEAYKRISNSITGFTDDEFEELINDDLIDFAYINKKRYFFERCLESLLESVPEMRCRIRADLRYEMLINEDDFHQKTLSIHDIISKGKINYYFRLRTSLKIKQTVCSHLSVLNVYLPIPIERYNQKNIKFISSSHNPDIISPLNYPQRTVYWNFQEKIPDEVWVEYSYNNESRYIDIKKAKFTNCAAKSKKEQKCSHTYSSPYIRMVVDSLISSSDTYIDKVIKIYDYITLNFRYCFSPSYIAVPSIADKCAKDKKGDCGQLSLLTIAMLQYIGLKARFVGGLQIDGTRIYSHDWVEVFSDNYGWVPLDPFCGIVSARYKNEMARQFYCGNIDPFRMVSTQEFFSPLYPSSEFLRLDPFDNQVGEALSDQKALGYNDLFHTTKVLACEKVTFRSW